MKKIIALNLKMNLGYKEILDYIKTIQNKVTDNYEVIFFPTSIYLDLFKKSGYLVGAQNVHFENKGAYTGEISPYQLKSLGVDYTLVGHSERRLHFKENDILINEKVKGALKNQLKVILCVGETDEERLSNKTYSVIENQLKNNLQNIDLEDVTIAYEPVWAIGSGKTPTKDEIDEVVSFIKKKVKQENAIDIRVLYGGSVNKENIKDIMSIESVDGVLVGSSSIDPNYLISMIDIID
ncbi:MAG TPA: triose-phosphate isomerase [Mollicutes bacterium]|nr:triose-phosphate isomerase [Mollicutes bacterium]